MFPKKHFILEMESIPRDKAVLQSQIIDSRRQLRRSNLTRFASFAMVIIACIIMFVWMPYRRTTSHVSIPSTYIYLPVVPHE